MTDKAHIVIVGGGVIGLSSAIALLSHPTSPCNVTLIATDLPSLDASSYSPDSSIAAPSSYASAWAGAHHVSDAKNPRQLQQDKVTFQVFQQLEKEKGFGGTSEGAALIWVHQTEYWEQKDDFNSDAIEWYPDHKSIPSSDLPGGVELGCTFSTYDIVVPQYLPRLYRMFSSLGGKVINRKVGSISEAIEQAKERADDWVKPCAILVSPGLGAKELLEDDNVHPVRGQTVLVRAPWCTTTLIREDKWACNWSHKWPGMSRVNRDGFRDMYILPRGDGTFILGGTRLADDWDTRPRQETTDDILRRVLSFMPTLVDPEKANSNDDVSLVDVVGVNVGLRPARKGGPRLEAGGVVNDVPVIYSYGYGGYGYQCSWGAAFDARDLIDDALDRPRAPKHSTLASLSIIS